MTADTPSPHSEGRLLLSSAASPGGVCVCVRGTEGVSYGKGWTLLCHGVEMAKSLGREVDRLV